MKNVNHIVWADLIRVIAILMVICIHCSDPESMLRSSTDGIALYRIESKTESDAY